MRCGAPATVCKHKTFSWFGRRMRVPLFFCEHHKKYWFRSSIAIGVAFALLFTVMIVLGVISDELARATRSATGSSLIPSVLLPLLLVIIFLDIVVVAFVLNPIAATGITGDGITLHWISREFVAAVAAFRERKRLEQVMNSIE